jgi:UDP-N-acetylmuramate--alanine ligase
LAQKIRGKAKNVTLVSEHSLKTTLDQFIKDGDVILMQGAGSIGQIAVNLMKEL